MKRNEIPMIVVFLALAFLLAYFPHYSWVIRFLCIIAYTCLAISTFGTETKVNLFEMLTGAFANRDKEVERLQKELKKVSK